MRNRHPPPVPGALELIAALDSADRESAWQRFLDRYAGHIWHVIRQSTDDPEQCNDCFLHVCENLCAHRYRRLRRYRPEGSASFRSWLGVVVANLCIDWQRSRLGRPRAYSSILRLDPLAQRVFHFRFLKGLDTGSCLAALQGEFPGLDEPRLANAVSRVNTELTPRQHWQLSVMRGRSLPDEADALSGLPAPGPDPEGQASRNEEHARINAALAQLPARQRQLLVMRYQQELSFREIARLARLGDPFRARRQVQAALDALAAVYDG